MIRLLHAADLHLDSPFSLLPPREAAEARAAQRRLPMKLVQLANARDCRLILLAGDVFDGDTVYPETVQALCDALASFRGRVFLSPGNHDPYTERSVWAVTKWPDNVYIFKTDYECVTLPELGCCVHGGAFLERECYEPIPMVEKKGYTNIGVYHGEVSASSCYRPIDKEELRLCGLDYLALGHIHQTSYPRQYGKTWFGWPGVTMSRGFDELGACGVFVVQLEQGSCAAEFVPVEETRYEILTMAAGTEPQIPADSRNIHCRLHLVGRSQTPDVKALQRRYEPYFLSLQIVDETLPERDLWHDCGDGTLRGLALEQLRKTEDPQLADLAARYLLAALEGREEP